MKNKKIILILILGFFICLVRPLPAMLSGVWKYLGYPAYTPEEQAYLEEIKKLEGISDENQLEELISNLSLKDLSVLRSFIEQKKLELIYPNTYNELGAQFLIKQDNEKEVLSEQIESINREVLVHKNSSILSTVQPETKQKYIDHIDYVRKKLSAPDLYTELYTLLTKQQKKISPIDGYYPTTELLTIRNNYYSDLITHIINLNAVELAGPKCQVTKEFHVDLDDYAQLMQENDYAQLMQEDEYLENISKEKTVQTLCNAPIAQRQKENECGLMSIYNSLQLYNLLNNKIDRKVFEGNLKKFNLDDWSAEVKSCPIDESDIINVIKKRIPAITALQYTIIPTIVDDNNQLSYVPLKNKLVIPSANGDISETFDQDKSLLHALYNLHDENIKKYSHIFFLNNLQVGAQGASMRHWIPVILHKENDQIYLYTINSQSIFYADLMDESDKVVNLEILEKIVTKDNAWIKALIQLLSINPKALELGLNIANSIDSGGNYNYNYVPDILKKIDDDSSSIAQDLRSLLNRVLPSIVN